MSQHIKTVAKYSTFTVNQPKRIRMPMPVELRRYDVTEGADDVQQASVRARRQLTSTGCGGASSCMPLLYTWTRVGYEVNLMEGALMNHSRNHTW